MMLVDLHEINVGEGESAPSMVLIKICSNKNESGRLLSSNYA